MTTTSSTLQLLLRQVVQGKIRPAPFWQYATDVLASGDPQQFAKVVATVSRLCVLIEEGLTQVPDIDPGQLSHYKSVLSGIAGAFVPPHALADAPAVIANFLNAHVLSFLGIFDRELSKAGIEQDPGTSKIKDLQDGLSDILGDLINLEIDEEFRHLISANLSRIIQALSAYQFFGSAYVDNIIKSFIFDIAALSKKFSHNDANSNVVRRVFALVQITMSVVPAISKFISLVDKLQEIEGPKDP